MKSPVHLFPPAKNPKRPGTDWAVLGATAVASSLLSVFIYRNFLGGEKKVTHGIHTDYAVADPSFLLTMDNVLGPASLEGNSVEILQNGKEIFPAMLAAIRQAKRSITFENFVFSRGQIASEFVEALAERARNGVKVHFLQDAMGCNCVHGCEMPALVEAGVSLEVFRYVHLRMNERTHRKLLVLDGEVGFIGGVGIADEWLGDADAPTRWRDTQYRVEGPVVAQLQTAFLDNWLQTREQLLHGDLYYPPLAPRGDLRCQVFQSSSAEGADRARLMLLLSIAAARKSLLIATAYFLPDALIIRTLIEARQRGVDVQVMVPGPQTDRTVVRHTGKSLWGPLLEAGIRFFEYIPARFHCKYLVADDLWTSVGSCNIDNRSLRLNEEANMNVTDKAFALAHREIFEKDKERCDEVTLRQWRKRPLTEKIMGTLGRPFQSQM